MSSIPAEAVASQTRAAEYPVDLARAPARIDSIDRLRGFVIVLMTLDHVRDYFSNAEFNPLDLGQTDFAMFMTRWITHLCAPIFVLLAGLSASLMAQRMQTAELRLFLISRGLWLIALEVTVVQFAWSFNFRYDYGLFLQVIWAIGASMVILGALSAVPRWILGSLAIAMIAGHNLLDGLAPATFGQAAWIWQLLHVQGPTAFGFVSYPLVPWIGVMILGFCAGPIFEMQEQQRRRVLVVLGATALSAFIVLRLINVYGDPHPWSAQSTSLLTVLSFLNVHKYPPSLAYLLVTLGIGVLLLAAFEQLRGGLTAVMRVFGRVPLFAYVLHIVLAHLAAGLLALASGFGDVLLRNVFIAKPLGWGFGLFGVYVAWLAVLAALYPACRWFAEVKRTRKEWWLAYL